MWTPLWIRDETVQRQATVRHLPNEDEPVIVTRPQDEAATWPGFDWTPEDIDALQKQAGG